MELDASPGPGQAGSRLGIYHTKQTKAKISEALTGENHPMFRRTGEIHPKFGLSLSDNTLAKMSEAQRSIDRTGENNPNAR